MEFAVAMVALLGNFLLVCVQIMQIYRLKKEFNDVKIVVNNISDLKRALNKPLDGVWEVRGEYELYHGTRQIHNCTGYSVFTWNEDEKRYEVYYSYSVRKEQDTVDLVTAICRGNARGDNNGDVGRKLVLDMRICSRSAADETNSNAPIFEFKTEKICRSADRITKLEFEFETNGSKGKICFSR